MVYDRRFTAASTRYPRIRRLDGKETSDGLCPSLWDRYALLTRSFLMVLDVDLASMALPMALSSDALGEEDLEQALVGNIAFVCKRLQLLQ